MAVSISLFDGATEHDITGDGFDIQIDRGRRLELSDYGSGGGVVKVENRDRDFDPFFLIQSSNLLQGNGDFLLQGNGDKLLLTLSTNSTGSYGPMDPGRKIVIKDGATTVFTGFVEDYDPVWLPDKTAICSLMVQDGMAALAQASFLEWTTTAQLSGARVSAILDRSEVGYPTGGGARSIATGRVPLQSNTIAYDTNVLTELQRVARSEHGRLYVNRTGVLTFDDRYASLGDTATATFDDTGSNLPFHGISVRAGTEQLHFQVTVKNEGGNAKTASNAAQIAANPNLGVRPLAIDSLLADGDAWSEGLADWLLDRFDSTAAIVSGLRVKLHDLSTADRATVSALDIGDVVGLNWTPTGAGSSVSQTLVIEGVTYRSSARADAVDWAEMDFFTSPAVDQDLFTLDTSVLDGTDILGF